MRTRGTPPLHTSTKRGCALSLKSAWCCFRTFETARRCALWRFDASESMWAAARSWCRASPMTLHGLPQALWANVRSLLSAYDARAETVRASTLFFRHHPGLQAHRAAATAEIEELIAGGAFEQALGLVSELGVHAEASLLYLQRYHWLLLYSVVVAQYMLWMAWVMLELVQDGGGDGRVEVAAGWMELARKAEVAVWAVLAVVLAILARLTVPVRLPGAACEHVEIPVRRVMSCAQAGWALPVSADCQKCIRNDALVTVITLHRCWMLAAAATAGCVGTR